MKRIFLLLGLAFGFHASAFAIPMTLSFSGIAGTTACSSTPNGSAQDVACANYSYLSQAFGDTADVNITYTDSAVSGNSLQFWDSSYNGQPAIFSGTSSTNSNATVVLTPLNGALIDLNEVTFGAYPNTTLPSEINIFDLANPVTAVFTYANTIGSGTMPSIFNFGPTTLASSATGFSINWTNQAYNVGLISTTYTTTSVANPPTPVSSPGTLGLLGAGLVGSVFVRRRTNLKT